MYSAGIPNWGHSDLGAQSGRKNQPTCLSCLSVCDIGVLWPNGWTDQDETWHRG